jgi:hypothetical protein
MRSVLSAIALVFGSLLLLGVADAVGLKFTAQIITATSLPVISADFSDDLLGHLSVANQPGSTDDQANLRYAIETSSGRYSVETSSGAIIRRNDLDQIQ